MTASPPPTPPNPSNADPSSDGARGAMRRLLDRPLGPDDLREHALRVAIPLTEETQDTQSLLIMRLGAELLALPASDVSSVHDDVPVHRIPHRTNDIIRGLCSIEGALLPTVALDRLLGITVNAVAPEDSDAGARRMIVIGASSARWAFSVDAVHGVDRFDVAAFGTLPVTVERSLVHYAKALVPIEDGHAALLDAERLAAGFQGALT